MFDFQKLEVYQKAKSFCLDLKEVQKKSRFDKVTTDQLRRASFSIMLNIAEGCSRFSNKDRKNFMVIARGSAFECVAILEYLSAINEIEQETYDKYEGRLDEISRMLYGLIRKLENTV
jgi:four helix bundle protein